MRALFNSIFKRFFLSLVVLTLLGFSHIYAQEGMVSVVGSGDSNANIIYQNTDGTTYYSVFDCDENPVTSSAYYIRKNGTTWEIVNSSGNAIYNADFDTPKPPAAGWEVIGSGTAPTSLTGDVSNNPPSASNVSVAGTLEVGEELTGSYDYTDLNSDAQSGSTFKWYRSDDDQGTNKAAISGATSTTYTLTDDDLDKYISFEVTPNDGTSEGTVVESTLKGPVLGPFVVASIERQDPSDETVSAQSVTFRVTFQDKASNVNADDFSLNSTVDGEIASVTKVDAKTYDVVVNNLTNTDGSLSLQIKGVDGASGSNDIERTVIDIGAKTITQTHVDDYLDQAKLGQTFTATTDNYLTAYTIYPKSGNYSFSGTADLKIYSGNELAGGASLIGSQTISLTSSTDASGQTFMLENPVQLTQGEVYSIVMNNFTGSGSHALESSTSGNYNDGRVIFTGTSTSTHTSFDLKIDIYEGTVTTGSDLNSDAPQTNESYTLEAANTAPVASNVTFTGTLEEGETLTGSYGYADNENDTESGTTFQWYRSDDASGTNKTAITGATSSTYTLTLAEATKFVSFEVTPNDGEDAGTAVESARQGPLPSYPPGVLSIARQAPSTETTGSTTVVFRVTFSDDVTNVDVTDFALNSTVNGTVSSVSLVSTDVYDVTVSGLDNAVGTVSLGIKGVDGEAGSNDIANYTANESLETNYNGSGDYLNQASIGQTFTASTSGRLSKITIYPKSGDHSFSGTATLSIYNGDQTADGTLILSQTVSITNSTDAGGQSFAIPALPQLTQGNTYSFLFSGFSGSGSHALIASTNAGFANGHVIFTGMNNTSHLTDLDLAFQVYESAVTTVEDLASTTPVTSESYTKEEFVRASFGDWPSAFVLEGGRGEFDGSNNSGLNVSIPDANDKRLPGFAVGDLDADGDMDFLIGSFTGKVYPMRNTGTSTAPNWEFVTGWISTIDTLDTEVGNGTELARPVLVDIDDDGDLDLFVGNQTGWDADEADLYNVTAAAMNDVVFFRNIGDIGNPVFEFQQIEGLFADPDNGTEWFHTNYGSFASPSFADLDGDDDFDMIVMGNDTISYAENIGTKEVPQFQRKYRENSPFEDFSPVTHNAGSTLSEPNFADIDNDGDLDLISGTTNGFFQVILNSGTANAPEFLNDNRSSNYLPDVLKTFDAGQHSLGRLADLNGDGVLDFVVGNLGSNDIGDLGWFSGVRNDPTMVSAVKTDNTTITITYSENVKTNGGNPTDFTVTDCLGNTYTVSAQVDDTAGDTDIVLTVASLESVTGDITITYSNANGEISDLNSVQQKTDDTGVVIAASDVVAPTMASATRDSNTEITITFSENVYPLGANPTDFTVTDDDNNTFAVSAISDVNQGDDQLLLTVANLSTAEGDLTITYTNNNNEVVDLACNALATDGTGVLIPQPEMIYTVSRQTPSDEDTNADELTFRVDFGEDVRNIDVTDFVLDGTATGDGTIASADAVTVGAEDARYYDIVVNGVDDSNGTISVGVGGTNGLSGSNDILNDNVVVDVDQITNAGQTNSGNTAAQSFQSTQDGSLVAISIKLNETSTHTGDMTLKIREGDGIGGNVIATQDFTAVAGTTSSSITITFDSPTELTSGQSYTFHFDHVNASEFIPEGSNNNPYANGRMYGDFSAPNFDWVFTTYISSGATYGVSSSGNTIESYTLDNVAPTVTITSNAGDPQRGAFTTTFTFSEDVTGFASDDIEVGNGAASNFNATSASVYTATITPASDGAVTVNVAADKATDAAGNANTAASQLSVTNDETAPTVTITSDAGNPQSGAFTATFTFSEAVSGFAIGDVSLSNALINNFDNSNAPIYTATITPENDGAVTVEVNAGAAQDNAGNDNTAATQLSVTNDETAPSRNSGAIVGRTYGLGQNMDITVEFNEAVLVETAGGTPIINIAMGGQTRSAAYLSGSGTTTLTFRYTTVPGDFDGNGVSLNSIQLNGGTISDAAGNDAPLTGTYSGAADVRVDTVIPSLTISSNSNQTSGAFTATFTFSEDMTGFTVDDISVGNGEASNFSTTSASIYTATITPAAEGTVTVDVAADAATDAGENGNTAATQLSVTNDETEPTLVSATKNSETQITLTFSEEVQISGADAGNFTVEDGNSNGFCVLSLTDGTAGDNKLALGFDDLSSAVAKLTIIYNPSSGNVSDFGGNNLAADATGVEILLDVTAPSGYSVSLDDDLINSSELTTSTFTFAGAEVGATYNYTVSSDGGGADVTGSGTIATATDEITLNDLSGLNDGELTLSVKLTDPASNEGVAVTDNTNMDATAPNAPTIGAVGDDNGPSNSDFITNDQSVVMGGNAEANSSVEVFIDDSSIGTTTTNGQTTWLLNYEGTDLAEGTYTITAKATDAAGNTSSSSTPQDVDIDLTAPTVVITSNANDPQVGAFTATFTFSEDMSGFAAEDITLSNAEASNFNTVSAKVYTASITPLADGQVTIDVLANKATDLAGNANTAATQFSVTNDETAPNAPIVASISTDAGSSATDNLTHDQTLEISGTAEADASVEVFIGGNSIGNTTADGSGDWTFDHTSSTLTEATHSITAKATDAAGNESAASTALDVTVDISAPSVSSGTIVGKTYGLGDNVDLTYVFNEAVVVDETNGTPSVTIAMGGQNRVATYHSGSGTNALVFRYTTVTGDIDGNGVSVLSISLNGGTIQDAAGNNANTSISVSGAADVRVDTSAPFMSITSSSNTVSGAFTATFTFNEDVSGFDVSDISVGNGSAGSFNTTSAKIYTAIITPLTEGNVTVNVAADKAQDVGGNGNTAASELRVVNDETAPTVVITSDATDPQRYEFTATFTFSEAVTGFDVSDITVGNGSALNFSATSASVYTATIRPVTDGEVTVDVNAAKAQDLAGNSNTAATQLSVTNDETAPTVLEVTSDVSDKTFKVGDDINIYVQYSEEVFVTGTPQLELETGATDRIIDYVDRSSSTLRFVYTVQAGDVSSDLDVTSTTALTLNGGKIVDAVDINADLGVPQGTAGGALTSKNIVIDGIAPTITITSNATDPQSGAFTATFTFSEEISGFDINDITVGNGVASNFNTTSAKIYTATITPSADGEVTINVAADMVQDVAGNNSEAATQLSVTNDETGPTVTVTSSVDPTSGAFTATFTFNEDVSNFTSTDITVTNALLSNFATASAKIYTATITPQTDGEVTLNVAADVAQDAAENGNTAASQLSVTNDEIAPTLVSGVKNSDTQITLTFSEPVETLGTNPTDFTVTDGNNSNFSVQTISDGTAGDNELILTFTDLSTAQLNLNIVYANNNAEVTDLAGNELASTRGGINISLNAVPTATNVDFSGTLMVGETLTGSYNYSDTDNDAESGTAFQWYRSDDNTGTNKSAISGATAQTYDLTSSDVDKYISFEVTPNDGKNAGIAVESSLQGEVSKISQTITFMALTDKTYGDASFTLSATASSSLGVSYTSSNTSVATINGNTVTIVGAGSTTISASQAGDASYAAATNATQGLTVNKAVITATAEDKSKTYGDVNPTFTISYQGFVNGEDETAIITEPTATTVANATTSVGGYDIDLSGGVADNYSFSLNSGTLTIGKATLTAAAEDKSKTYGEDNPTLTIAYSGFVNGDDETVITTEPVASTAADATTGVGNYDIDLSGGLADNYSFNLTSGTLTIGKAVLTATADDKSKTYGEDNPEFTVTYSGFVNGDDESAITAEPTASTSADATTGVGTYEITLNGGTAANYSLITDNGLLVIGKATLTATAEDKSKTYGEDNPALTIAYSGFVNGDNESVITTEPTASTTADATTVVGTYNIDLAGGAADNYNFSLNSGALTIGKAVLTATADDKSKTYGDVNPTFTVSYTGFVNGDDEGDITQPTITSSVDETSHAGVYDITLTGGAADNYTVVTANGSLTIGKATLTATADDMQRAVGQDNPNFTIAYSGFVNGDSESDIDTKPTASTIADASTVAGAAAITLSGGADNNYSFNLVDGTLTIVEASFVSSVTVPNDGTYKIGNEITFSVIFALPVTTTGTPGINLQIGSETKTATLTESVSGGLIANFSYTIEEGDLDADGISLGTSIELNGGTIVDGFGSNAILTLNNVSNTASINVDGVRASPTLSASVGDLTNGAFTVTVAYDEQVSGLTATDLDVANGTVNSVSTVTDGLVWEAEIMPTADGTTSVSVLAGAVADVAGNTSVASTNSISTTFDGTAPTVTSITRAEADQIPTGIANRTYTVIFSEEVTGVDATDFEVETTGTATASISSVSASDAKTYEVTIGSISGEGTIGLNAKDDGSIIDAASNSLAAAITGDVYTTNFVPTDISISTSEIQENNAVGDEVATFSTTDADLGDSHTYTLVSGTGDTDNASFTITNDKLLAAETFDFEAEDSYSIRVKTEDGFGGSFEKQLIISITNEGEANITIGGEGDFERTTLGLSSTKTWTITNNGDVATEVRIISASQGFSFSPGAVQVGAGESKEITAAFSPSEAKVYSGVVVFNFDITDEIQDNVIEVNLSGEGVIVTGIDYGQISEEQISVFPNPASNYINIDLSDLNGMPLDIRMVNPTGVSKLEKEGYDKQELRIDVTNFENGLYIIQFSNKRSLVRKKVLIRK